MPTPTRPRLSRRLPLRGAGLWLCGLLWAAVPVQAQCVDPLDKRVAALAPAQPTAAQAESAQRQLHGLVQAAIARSQSVGAAALLAEAARADLAETLAGGQPQASLSASTGAGHASADGAPARQGGQAQASLTLSGLLYDGGRLDRLGAWRGQLAEAAHLGQLSSQEQVALQTVSGALESSRYQLQARVYQQHGERIQCLVRLLQQVVEADRGRESELVQVRKSGAQVSLLLDLSRSRLQQAEVRLQRFVGEVLPPLDDAPLWLQQTPELAGLQRAAADAVDLAQLAAQAQAAEHYARAVALSGKPQLNWTVSGVRAAGLGSGGTSLNAGLQLNLPLASPGLAEASLAASRRAEAARLQRQDALEARFARLAEAHAQATSALERAQRTRAVIADSERLRDATLMQWQQLGRRSLFDVMAAENDLLGLRVSLVDALADAQQANALLLSLGRGLRDGLR